MINRTYDELIIAQIKKAREAKGWSMMELSRRTGIAKSSITAYESFVRSMPFDTFKKICGALDLDYIEVFDKAHDEFVRIERNNDER